MSFCNTIPLDAILVSVIQFIIILLCVIMMSVAKFHNVSAVLLDVILLGVMLLIFNQLSDILFNLML